MIIHNSILQSTGDVLNVTHYRAWEFDPDFPLRTVIFSYALAAPPLYLLRSLNSTGWSGLHISTVKVVMSTRLPIAFLSVTGYLATGKLADTFHVDHHLSTVLYCSSYVTWTYFTRTFSNSIESVLLAILFLLVVPGSTIYDTMRASKIHRDTTFKESEKERKENKKKPLKEHTGDKSSKENQDEIKTHQKEENYSEKNGSLKPVILGSIVAAGIFNRPTFVVFAFIPLTFWLYRKMHPLQTGWFSRLLSTSVSFVCGVFITCTVFVFADTLYYKPAFIDDFKEILDLIVSGEISVPVIQKHLKEASLHLVLTPLNFFLYNKDPSNLAKHGLHPRSLHFFVNLPLLLGPLYLAFIFILSISVYEILIRRGNANKNTGPPTHLWLVLMAIVPVLALSIFPHQEPRFLIPALPVFMVIGAKFVAKMAPAKLSFMAVWVVFNVLLTLFYGYMHQGALIPAVSIYQQKLSAISAMPASSISSHHAIFYKTYPPPRHLLLLPTSSSGHVHIHDLEGGPVSSVQTAVLDGKAQCRRAQSRCQIFLFIPATVTARVEDHLSKDFKLQTTSICPHLSMEASPRVMAWWRKKIGFNEFVMELCLNIIKVT